MDLNQLRCFIAVAETNSFIRAAEKLNLTGPAISKHIANLEKHTHTTLFHRSTRFVRLSEQGALLLKKITPAVADIDDAINEVGSQSHSPSGKIKVSVAMSFGHHCLLDFFTQFAKDYPNLTLDLSFEDKFVDLLHDDVDILIRVGRLQSSAFYAKKLAHCPFWLCASPMVFASHPRPDTIQAISQLPAIVYQNHRTIDYWEITSPQKVQKIPLNPIMVCNTAESLLAACKAGLGIAELPAFCAQTSIDKGELEILFPEYAQHDDRAIYAIYKTRLEHSSRINSFISKLMDYCAKHMLFKWGAKCFWP